MKFFCTNPYFLCSTYFVPVGLKSIAEVIRCSLQSVVLHGHTQTIYFGAYLEKILIYSNRCQSWEGESSD